MSGEHLQDNLDTSWMAFGACAGVSPSKGYEIFFPTKSGRIQATIRSYCDRCPVKIECDEYATRMNITSGIWGGRSRST